MKEFENRVAAELARARQLHPQRQPSLHHGFAVLLEEVGEFKAHVFKKDSERNYEEMLTELVQIAACAQRTAEEGIFPKL
jgi:NTP pyrophosphatase (non-canonical NTP hydrolase)